MQNLRKIWSGTTALQVLFNSVHCVLPAVVVCIAICSHLNTLYIYFAFIHQQWHRHVSIPQWESALHKWHNHSLPQHCTVECHINDGSTIQLCIYEMTWYQHDLLSICIIIPFAKWLHSYLELLCFFIYSMKQCLDSNPSINQSVHTTPIRLNYSSLMISICPEFTKRK